ncbi:actin-depolymerizing factor 1-like isoform X4 [Ziziphus jujuba]|uniref:Actin-depolymerizing factor 1-like isoform X4 n=1 Tax=Ziziphus jujuba TaxID=326968 RepID=A0A6P3ZDL0_ZIZJJ|nr:actin-depolymerizing factor 1-like isoform X4 [Ziziphus jujuba]
MKNAILPPVSSHIYDFGNNEIQILPNWDIPMQFNSKIAFCMDSEVLDNDNQIRAEAYSFPIQSSYTVTHQPAGFPTTLHHDENISHQSMRLGKKILAPQFDTLEFFMQAIQNARKRPIEVDELLPKNDIGELIGNQSTDMSEWRKIKRNKTTNFEHQWQEGSTRIQQQRLLVPTVRRTQKLSDKITALQKLVSPYGKTDTASVLQEASGYIKLLQDQIRQNLFRMLSSSYDSVRGLQPVQEKGKGRLDLRSRGLCLVPISFTQKVTMEERVDHNHALSLSRKPVLDRNFYCLN